MVESGENIIDAERFSLFKDHLLPKEVLVDIEDSEITPTGFRVSYTERVPEFISALDSFYPKLSGSFSGKLALKHCGEKDGGFCTTGIAGEKTIIEEALVGERQAEVGFAPDFLAFAKFHGGEAALFSEDRDGLTPVIGMPKFDDGQKIEEVYKRGVIQPGSHAEQVIGERLVRRLFSMSREVEPKKAVEYGTMQSQGILNLVVDDRMISFERDPIYGDEAKFVNWRLESTLSNPSMQDLLLTEVDAGRITEQQGDPRFSNIYLVVSDSVIDAFLIDAVRLRKIFDADPRRMEEWFITHPYLQLGMMLGKALAASNGQYRGLLDSGMKTYVDHFQPKRELENDPLHVKLATIGHAYGLSVEAHVINYERLALMKMLGKKEALEFGGDDAVEERILEIEQEMDPLWEALVGLSETNYRDWREIDS
jgi:hypothetical protein